MGAVIEIRDWKGQGRLAVCYAVGASEHRVSLTRSYREATRFAADELDEQLAFWRELLDDPNVEVAAVE